MLFAPDIVVMEPTATAPALIVEVRLNGERSVEAVQGLKTYMVRSRCPVGLLVSPDRLTIFRDEYLGEEPDSVAEVGTYPVSFERPAGAGAVAAWALENKVQSWLTNLRDGEGWDDLPEATAAALRDHVLPELTSGSIRAAGPRELHS